MNFVDKSLEIRNELRRFTLGWLTPHKLASEKTRAELNLAIKNHWKAHTIEVYELILEEWEPDGANNSGNSPECKDERFLVFIDNELDLDWIANFEGGDETDKCVSYAESIGARRCNHLPKEQILEFKRLIGQAIVNGIRGECKQSSVLAEEAAQFLKDRTIERSRSWTLSSAHVFVVLFTLALTIFWLDSRYIRAEIDANIYLLWLAIEGGIIGSYLSVIQRAGSGQWDAAAGRALHNIEVSTKLFAGGILGGLAFTLARSTHAPSWMKDISPDAYSAIILGVVAGLFERTIPKIISTYASPENPQNPPNK